MTGGHTHRSLPLEAVEIKSWTQVMWQQLRSHLTQLPKDQVRAQLHKRAQPLHGTAATTGLCPVTTDPTATAKTKEHPNIPPRTQLSTGSLDWSVLWSVRKENLGQVQWLVPVIPALSEAKAGRSPAHFGKLRWADHMKPGVQDQPDQHGKTQSLLKIQKSAKHGSSDSHASASRVAGITDIPDHSRLIFFAFLVEMGFHYVAKAGLELPTLRFSLTEMHAECITTQALADVEKLKAIVKGSILGGLGGWITLDQEFQTSLPNMVKPYLY
ncbi:hypothetical protein AAY473_035389 [Plecturocebus cupreus]